MAADSRTSAGSHAVRHAPKLHRLADGRIVAACGVTSECVKIVRWLSEGGDKPELEDVEALILNTDGSVHFMDAKLEPLAYDLPAAIGSGSDIAIGALLAGKTPKEAVEIAALRDMATGGEITSMSILRAVA